MVNGLPLRKIYRNFQKPTINLINLSFYFSLLLTQIVSMVLQKCHQIKTLKNILDSGRTTINGSHHLMLNGSLLKV